MSPALGQIMKTTRLVSGTAALLVLATACSDGVLTAADSAGPPAPPPPGVPPTGQRFDEQLITDACGRTTVAYLLVDEMCGGDATLPDLDALRAPMFRDGAMVNGTLLAVDGTQLWRIDESAPEEPARADLATGSGTPIATAATAEGTVLVAAGDEGLVTVALEDDGSLTATGTTTLPGPALDVAEAGEFALVAAGPAGLVFVERATGLVVDTVATGGPAVAVTVSDDGTRAYVAACSELAIVDLPTRTVLGSTWRPARVGNIDHAPAKDVAVLGNVAFVAAGRHGVVAVDIRDPALPRVVGECTNETDLSYYVSGVKIVPADEGFGGTLYVAAGEWGVDVHTDPIVDCAGGFQEPEIAAPPPVSDEDCSALPPWQVLPVITWEPPPPGHDPIQIVIDGGALYAMGDARRNGIRSVDGFVAATALVDGELPRIGRFEEPRLLDGVAAGGGRIVAGGAAGGVFLPDDLALLTPDAASAAVLGAPVLLGDGSVASVDGTVVHTPNGDVETGVRLSPRAVVRAAAGGGEEIVVASETDLWFIDPATASVTRTSALPRLAVFPPALALVDRPDGGGQDVGVASPEWDTVALADGGELAPHAVFTAEEILDVSLWRFGAPRRVLVPAPGGLVEVVSIADRAALVQHDGNGVLAAVPLAPLPYVAGAADASRVFLVTADHATYRSSLVTISLAGEPRVTAVDAFVGVASGIAVADGRAVVADTDGALRVYALAGDTPAFLGAVRVTP
jgi:hypothetical protein